MASHLINAEETPFLAHIAALGERQWGPAMTALPVHLRAFVVAKVGMGHTGKESARAAGSRANDKGLEVIASKWSHQPDVQLAMAEELRKRFISAAPQMLSVLETVATSKGAKAADRVRASVAILDRAGFGAISEQKVSVEHSGTVRHEAGVPTMKELLARAGLDPKALGVRDDDAIDAEFTALDAVVDLAGQAEPVAGVGYQLTADDPPADLAERQAWRDQEPAETLAQNPDDEWTVPGEAA
jgi:hypothetical protein